MKWLLLTLLFLMQVGCAIRPSTSGLPAPLPLTNKQWQGLAGKLVSTPDGLAQAIEREATIRLEQQHLLSSEVDPAIASTELLANLVGTSTESLLQADERFNRLLHLVDGSQPEPNMPFAQALANFLLQDDFSCRHPIFHTYFQERYQVSATPCQEPIPFLLASRDEGIIPRWIKPEQLNSIHLFFAGHGEKMASRFGHVALRLIVCPDGRLEDGVCNSNLYEHIVLGYMAHIDEFELNSLKALSGDYKAHLFAFPFMDAYRGYAIDEFREIFSIPLQLNHNQRQILVRQLAEIHWRYTGGYNFFSQNCATLLQQALRDLLPRFNHQPQLADNYLRPDSFFTAIKETTLLEPDHLDSLAQAEEEGYYFSSTKDYYKQALGQVAAAMVTPPFTDINSYLQRSPQTRLDAFFADNPAYWNRLSHDQYLLEAQLLLEELALLRGERRFLAEASRYFRDFDLADIPIDAKLTTEEQFFYEQCLLRSIRQVTEPIPHQQSIPTTDSALPALPKADQCQGIEGNTKLTTLLGKINDQGRQQWQRVLAAGYDLDETTKNILILEELRDVTN